MPKKKSAKFGGKHGLTALFVDFSRTPALRSKYKKNPKAFAKKYRLTASQIKALKSKSNKQVGAALAKDIMKSYLDMNPLQGTVQGGNWGP